MVNVGTQPAGAIFHRMVATLYLAQRTGRIGINRAAENDAESNRRDHASEKRVIVGGLFILLTHVRCAYGSESGG